MLCVVRQWYTGECDGEGKVGGKRSGGGSESGKTLEIELPAGLND